MAATSRRACCSARRSSGVRTSEAHDGSGAQARCISRAPDERSNPPPNNRRLASIDGSRWMAPSQTRWCSMTFAMSPGDTNETVGAERARSWGQRRPVRPSQVSLSRAQSARLLLAQALHNRAAPRSWLPLRTSADSAASVVGVELHIHPDVGVCSIRCDELIAVLLHRSNAGAPPSRRRACGMDELRKCRLDLAERCARRGIRKLIARPPPPTTARKGRMYLRPSETSVAGGVVRVADELAIPFAANIHGAGKADESNVAEVVQNDAAASTMCSIFALSTGRLRAGCRPKPHDGEIHSRSSPTTRAQSAARSRIFLTVSIP